MLAEVSFPYVPLDCSLCNTYMATSVACCQHLRRKHGFTKVSLVCASCGISYKRKHNVECHTAICADVPKRVPTGSVACPHCNKVCKSTRGLTLHKRAAHRTEFLAQLAEPGRQVAPKRRVWTEGEVAVLSSLLQEEGENSGILARACALTERTKDQVRYKMRQLKRTALPPVSSSQPEGNEELIKELTEEREQPLLAPVSIVRRRILRALAKGKEGKARGVSPSPHLEGLLQGLG